MVISSQTAFKDVSAVGSAFETDPVLGFYVADSLLEQLYEYCKTTPDPSYLVSADFTNLMQLNDVIGREKANDVMRTIAAIYEKAFAKLLLTTRASFRVQGDGINWILEGGNLSQKDLKTCLAEAEKETQAFTERAGLSRIQHKRHENVAGIGLATTFSEIGKSSGSLTEMRNEHAFELSTAREIVANKVQNPLPASEFLQQHYLDGVIKALDDRAGLRAATYPGTLPENFAVQPVVSKHSQSRSEEMEFLRQARNNGQATLIRFNLYNLGGLNSLIGNDHVDENILEPVRNHIRRQLAPFPPEYRQIYDRGGGVLDIIVPTHDHWVISELQKAVQSGATADIFGKPIDQFTNENKLEREDYELSGDTLVANIPHKRDRLPGTGMISVTAPIKPGAALEEAFQSLEAQQRLQEYHGIRYFEQKSPDSPNVRALLIRQSANPAENEIHPSAARLPGAEQNPYSWALANRFTHEQLADLFRKPAGMIYEALTGITLQPVLNRQEVIFHLMDKGVDVARIKEHLAPQEEFDRFMREEMHEKNLSPVYIAGRPSTRPHGHPEFLTFNLARGWGYIPPKLQGIDEILLQAQAAMRALDKLNLYKKGVRNIDSAQLLPEIRSRAATILEDARRKTDPLQTAQFADQVLQLARHEHGAPDPQTILAGHSLVAGSWAQIAQSFDGFGLDGMADEVRKLSAPLRLGNRKLEKNEALTILSQAAGLEALRGQQPLPSLTI
jgi:hypothetical protein